MNQVIKQFQSEGVLFKTVTDTVAHMGKSVKVQFLEIDKSPFEGKGSGRLPSIWGIAENQIIPAYNEEIIEAAKRQIEAEIQAEKERQRAEAENREKARLEAEKQAEAEKNRLLAEIENLKNEPKKRFNKATKYISVLQLTIITLLMGVAIFMNGHNLSVLYSFIPGWVLYVFAFTLSVSPLVFAWAGDEKKVKASTIIIPIDFAIAVILFFALDGDSPLVQNWGWLQSNLHFAKMTFSIIAVSFYSWQVYLIAMLIFHDIRTRGELFMATFKK